MIAYVKTIVAETQKALDSEHCEGVRSRHGALERELHRIDPRDFEPSHQHTFVDSLRRLELYVADLNDPDWEFIGICALDVNCKRANQHEMSRLVGRLELRAQYESSLNSDWPNSSARIARGISNDAKGLLVGIEKTLDFYLGPDARIRPREFAFIRDLRLREIVERDYRELMLKLFPSGSWKSVVILAGSILEGLLFDLLTRDPMRISDAMKSKRAPQKKEAGGKSTTRVINCPNREDQWLLDKLIEVADDLALLPTNWKQAVQAVLRDFRNYVHPLEELRATDKITQGEAFQSVGALMKIADHIQMYHP